MGNMFRKYTLVIIIAILLIAAGIAIYIKVNPPKLPKNLISGTGRFDGDLISLNTKYSGRVLDILVEDGQSIKKGDIIAKLESREYEAKLKAINGSIDAAKYGLKSMKHEYNMIKTSIFLGVQKASRATEIAHSQKIALSDSIASLKKVVEQNKRDNNRIKRLYASRLVSKQKMELSKLKLTNNLSKLARLKQEKIQIEKNISIAKDSAKLAKNEEKRLLYLKNNIEAAVKKIDVLKAKKEELQAVINALTIKSPIDGVVIEKIAQKGEVLAPGMIVATLLDPHSLYLKMFIDTIENGRVKIKDKAVIFLDANPDNAIEAEVVNIAQRAEFTPKEVSVRSDRIQRVYAVELKPLKINPLLKLGIPAVGVISTDSKGLPSSLKDIPSI